MSKNLAWPPAAVAALVALLLIPALSGVAAAGGRPIAVPLSGAAEPSGGDPDGSGIARLTLNPGQGEVCYELVVQGIAPATGAHVHRAPVGINGEVVIGLAPPANGRSSGCVDVERELIRAMLRDPSAYYFNVHNADYAVGALRGQLGRTPR